MSEIVNRRRNIFINSEQYHDSKGHVKLIFPGNDFAVDKNEHMRISLESFTMARNFYNVNANNNTFYVRDKSASTHTYTEVVIQEGDYATFDGTNTSMGKAIEDALSDAGFSNSSVTYDTNTRLYEINMSSASNWSSNHDFVCFQITDNSVPPTNVSSSGKFNDSCELLGGRPTKSSTNIKPAFTTNGSSVFTGVYPASLYTLKAIHMRTNLQTHSYQTPNFDANRENSSLIPSDIFAKIFVSHHEANVFTPEKGLIQYSDNGANAFAIDLQNKTLPEITIRLTDDKGRELPAAEHQHADGNLSYLATLKWTAISSPMIGKETGMPRPDLQMKLYN